MADASNESPSGSLIVGVLIGPLSAFALMLAGLSSLPLLSEGRANFLVLALPGILCGWAAPRRWWLLAALPTAVLLGLLGTRAAYFAHLVIPMFVLAVFAGAAIGALLARFAPLRARALMAAVLLFTAGVAGYLAFRDRVVFILQQSQPSERRGEGILGVPDATGRAQALIAIGQRLAEKGHRDEAKDVFREARRNAALLEMGPSALIDDVVHAEIAGGMYRTAEDDLAAVSWSEEERRRFLANAYLSIGEIARARVFISEMAPKDRFYFLQKLAEAEALADRRDLAHASIQELWALAHSSSEYDRPTHYAAVGNTLIRLGFTDEGLEALSRYAPEELPLAAKRAEAADQPELALQLWGLAADAGITLDHYGIPHRPLPNAR